MKSRVLLVDDEETILSVLQKYVEKMGYEALLAHNGVEALEILGVEQVDSVVTDITMPRMGGLDLAMWVKELYPAIWVVGISGQMQASAAEELPFDAFLSKPFDFHQFEKALTGRRARLCDRHFEIW